MVLESFLFFLSLQLDFRHLRYNNEFHHISQETFITSSAETLKDMVKNVRNVDIYSSLDIWNIPLSTKWIEQT